MFNVSDKVVCVNTGVIHVLTPPFLFCYHGNGLKEGTVYCVSDYQSSFIEEGVLVLRPSVFITGIGWKLAERFRKVGRVENKVEAQKARELGV